MKATRATDKELGRIRRRRELFHQQMRKEITPEAMQEGLRRIDREREPELFVRREQPQEVS